MLNSGSLIQLAGLPWWLSGKESTCNAGDTGSSPGSGRPLEKEIATTLLFSPEEFHRQRSLVGCSSWSHEELDKI